MEEILIKSNNVGMKTIFRLLMESKFLGSIYIIDIIIENDTSRTMHIRYTRFPLSKKIQCHDWWKRLFWSANKKLHENIQKYLKDCKWSRRWLQSRLLARLSLFLKILYYTILYYYNILHYLSKQQALHADPKAIHKIYFTGHLNLAENTLMFFIIIEELKENILDFS